MPTKGFNMKNGIRTLAAAGALLVAGSVAAAGVPGQGTWETTLLARDINGDSVVDAYYDTVLGISWLADANLAGVMTWDDSVAWAASLDVHGVSGWRLPSTVDDISLGGVKPAPTSSEMAHMYYVTLGNIGYPDAGYGPSNVGSFRNVELYQYWSSNLSANQGWGWYLHWAHGSLDGNNKAFAYFAWPVHDGDVAPPPIPEPGTYALMLAGIAAIGLSRRFR